MSRVISSNEITERPPASPARAASPSRARWRHSASSRRRCAPRGPRCDTCARAWRRSRAPAKSRARPPRRGGCLAAPTAPPPVSRRPRRRPRSRRARRCRRTSPYLHLLSILAAASTAAVTAECSALANVRYFVEPENARARRHRAGRTPLARGTYMVKVGAISSNRPKLGVSLRMPPRSASLATSTGQAGRGSDTGEKDRSSAVEPLDERPIVARVQPAHDDRVVRSDEDVGQLVWIVLGADLATALPLAHQRRAEIGEDALHPR